jgi:DNA replication protein DnaC
METCKTVVNKLAGDGLLLGGRNYPLDEVKAFDLNWESPAWLTADVQLMHREAQWFLNDLAHRRGAGRMAPRWLVLCGPSGCGKSHLAQEIRNTARRELGYDERTAQMWKCSRYAERLRSGQWDFQDHLLRLPLLVLDDLGAEQASDMWVSKLFDLLDGRLDKWTVITSNLSVSDVAEKLDVRIASRFRRGGNVLVSVHHAEDFCHRIKTDAGV